jgi:hypothetical protein
MRTKVFSYKGWVGIQSDVKAEGLLNKPLDKGQLGFVLDANFVDISPEALELLKKVPLSGDCIGEVDIFKSQKEIIFSWLGGPLKMFQPEKISGSSSYDASLITDTVDVEIDPAFIEAIDKNIPG